MKWPDLRSSLLLVALVSTSASAHFNLNLNLRIFHVEHLADGLRIYQRLPMPYLVANLLGEKIKRASPEFVRDNTGYAIGGVPPVAHRIEPIVLIDETLFDFECLWAAAGTPNAVFRLLPEDLSRLTAGVVADIAEA